jgi:hypothetical protein
MHIQMNASGGSVSVADPVGELVRSVYQMLQVCDSSSVPSLSSLAVLVQQCAQHTAKIIHIAFDALDESLEAHIKASQLYCDKVIAICKLLLLTFSNIAEPSCQDGGSQSTERRGSNTITNSNKRAGKGIDLPFRKTSLSQSTLGTQAGDQAWRTCTGTQRR